MADPSLSDLAGRPPAPGMSLSDLASLVPPPANPAQPPEWMARGIRSAAGSLMDLPARVASASENLRTGNGYDAAPAVEAATMLMGGGAGLAEKGAAGIFGGRLAAQNLAAKGIDGPMLALKMAEHMESQGLPKEDIYKVTSKMMEGTPYAGVSKGAEGKWRFEIPDRGMSVSPGNGGYWDQHVDHPDYFAAYPRTGGYEANINYGDPSGSYWGGGMSVTAPTRDEMASVAAHEMQHAAQATEGFSRGANPGSFTKAAAKAGATPDQLREAAFTAYERAAGEVEARNVQKRLTVTPEQRRASPPWETEDVPRDQQIVRSLSDLMPR